MPSNRVRSALLVPLTVLALLAGSLQMPLANAAEITITVNSLTDASDPTPADGICDTDGGGTCTFRGAIETVNATTPPGGSDTWKIAFTVPGTITLTGTAFPTITGNGHAVNIDASQAGFTTPPVQVDGSGAPSGSIGVHLVTAQSSVKGLSVTGFGGAAGIGIKSTATGVAIHGNYVGVGLDGSTAGANGTGIDLTSTNNNTVEGNVVSGNTGQGIHILNSNGPLITGNMIGTNAAATAAVSNGGHGIIVQVGGGATVTGTVIGGPNGGEPNVISGNTLSGISVNYAGSGSLAQTTIQGNFIGTDPTNTIALGNGRDGIEIGGPGTVDMQIGGLAGGEGNVIAHNTLDGVSVLDNGTPQTTGADIEGNSIDDNGDLGIDLANDGVTNNDGTGDADTGPNDLQDFPVISGATTTSADFTLDSRASRLYEVAIFASAACDGSGHGEGAKLLVSAGQTTDGSGSVSSQLTFGAESPGTFLTATATDSVTGDTSEFSGCFPIPGGGASADLEVQVNGMPATVKAGQPLAYSVDVTNHGPDDATGVDLDVTLPADVDTVVPTPDTGDCIEDSGHVLCSLGDIANGTTVRVALTMRTSTAPGPLSTSASANATSGEGADTFPNTDNAGTNATDATPGFAPARSYGLAGTGAHSIVTGDFDEDGNDDVVVSNSNGVASFLPGATNGHLGTATAITLAGTPRWIAAGKVDGDTHLDLIANTEVCSSGSSCGTLQFASGNGNGTFDAPVTVDVGNGPASIALADVDGDGELDLIAADTIGKDLSVSLGNGDGTFDAADDYPGGSGGSQYGVAVGLLNADDAPDIVVTGGTSAKVFLNTDDGSGSFENGVSYPTGSTSSTPTPSLADLNGDNSPDLVVSGSARILLNDGAGVLSAATEAIPSSAFSAAVGDFNLDGQTDVEAATGATSTATPDLVQALGAGDGTFAPGADATLQYRVSTGIATADLNTNAASDLVIPHVADDRITVLLATPAPQITNLVVSHGATDTFQAGFSPIDERSLDFAGVSLDPAILAGAAGPLDAPLQGRPLQGRPLQGRPLQGRPLQGRPLQGRPLQGRAISDAPSAFAFAPFETLVNHAISDPPLITQIGLDVPGGWPAQLQGTALATLPPQEIDLNEVIANTTVWNRVRVIALDHFDLSQTALGNLPPIAELAGSAVLTDFAPAASWTDPGGWLDTMSPVCATPVASFNPSTKTLVDLALARCPLTVVPWETLRVQDFHLTTSNAALFHYGMLGIDPAAIRLGAGPATLGDLTLDRVPTGIVNCTLIACDSAHTLADAFDATLAQDAFVIRDDATFTPFLTGGTANGGGAVTADDLIGDMTIEQFLLGAIAPQDFPYVLLSTGQLLDAAPPGSSGAIPYSAAFDVACPTPAGTAISFTLPNSRFGFVRGSASFDIGTPVESTVSAGNPNTNGNVLRWDLPDNATVCGAQSTGTKHVKLSFEVQPAPVTGVFNSSAKISNDDLDTVRTTDPNPITLTESGGPKSLSNPQTIGPDDLVLGQFATPDDVNIYKIPLTQADVGALVTVVLSNGNESATSGIDNDLMLYGSAEASLASAPLQGRPLQGRPIGDQEGCLPPGYVLNGQGLEGVPHFESPTRAVRGFSTNRSDYPEIVCTTVQESDVAGGLLVQVSHFAGSTGDHPYVLSHTIEQVEDTGACVGPDLQYQGNATQHGRTPTTAQYSRVLESGDTIPSGTKTLFVINAERFGDLYGYDFTGTQPGSIAEKQILDDLQLLAARPEVNGRILPVEIDSAVAGKYTALDGNPCSVTAANDVVSSINDLIRDVETPNAGPRIRPDNVVMVGDDDVIPFARLRDGTTLGNQVAYAPNIRSSSGPNPISKAFGRGYILSDEPFGTTLAPISVLGNVVYVADTALGRLIETPDEIHGQIQHYVSVDGLLDPKTRLSTGADFASSVGEQIADTFEEQTDALNDQENTNAYTTKALLTGVRSGSQWTAEPGWTKAAMLCRLDGFNGNSPTCSRISAVRDFTPPGLISVSGHANHLATLAGNGSDTVTSDDIAGISRNSTDGTAIPDGSLLFTIGCNAGVNVPDAYLPAPDEFDLPQALASRDGSFVGNFGFGYGDTTRLAFSEKLMKLFANNLDGSVTIGQAISQAKGSYWSQLVTSSPYDIKALEQSTLYGLPFYRITGAGNTNNQNAPNTEQDPDTGLPSTLLSLPRENSNDQFFVDPVDDRRHEADGDFFVGPNTQVVPGQPIQPTSNPFFLTQPGLRLHGALVTSLSVHDIQNFDPVIARLVLDGTPGQNTEPIVESGVFPTAYSTITTVQGDDYLVLNGGRFTATGAGVGTQRVYTQESVRALWSDRSGTDFTAPDVAASGQLIGNGYATFQIRSFANDVSAAYIMYRPGGGAHPERFKLVRLLPTSPGLYSATVQVGTDGVAEFFGEVADTHGNVGFDVLKGASVALQSVVVTPPAGVTTQIVPDGGTTFTNGFYSGPVDVVITQRAFASIQTQVDFGPAQTFSPTSFFGGTTARVDVPAASGAADGIHRVDYSTAGRSATVVVPIDGLPPDIQYQIGSPKSDTGPGAPYVTPSTPINVVVTDAASGVQSCSIERFFPPSASTGTMISCAEGANPVTLGTDDGRYRIRTIATDTAGHERTLDQIFTVTRDNLPPTITPTVGSPKYPAASPTPYVRTITDVVMTIRDPDSGDVPGSGVDTCSTTVVGPIPSGGPEPGTSNAGCDPLTSAQTYHASGNDGTYRFDTTATDKLGNTGHGSQTVQLDNTRPVVTVSRTGTPVFTSSGTTFVTSATGFRTATSDPSSISGPGSGVASCLTSLASNGTMAPGAVASLPNPAACATPTHSYALPGSTPDGPYRITGTADDNVTNHNNGTAGTDGSSGPLDVTLDNTAPIMGMCPTTPLQRSATVLASAGTGTGTTFTVNEEATAPRVPFVIRVGSELMKVRARSLVSGTTSQYTYTVDRGLGGTTNVQHTAGSEIAWDLLARQDLLGTPTGTISATVPLSGSSTFNVLEERFGAPALPFTITVDNEQMLVTARTLVTGSTYQYTAKRAQNGTSAASHGTSSQIFWTGETAGVLNASLTNSATVTTMSVKEGRFGPTSVPFDVTVDGERMTVVRRANTASPSVFTYTMVRGVNGTKVVAHAANAAVVMPPVGAVYLNSPNTVASPLRTLSVPAIDDQIFPGVPGSGVASNPSQVVPAGPVGTYPVTFTATDNLGNARTKTCSYEVIYKLSGFYLPVDMSIVNSRNAGAAVPTKWKITDFNLVGQTSPSTFKEITASKTIPASSSACSASNPDFSVASEDVRGGSALQNQGGGVWQYNWSPNTTKGTCTTMTVRLRQSGLSNADPTRWYQYAVFKFK